MPRMMIVAAFIASLAAPVNAAGVENFFSGFFSFGDSLTDDGKFGVLDPPSFGGRFTNGLTWSEYIEDAFGAAGKDNANFALGGATAGPVNLNNPGALATFDKQIDAFSASLGASLLDPGVNPLVSVWFGANDIFQGFSPIAAADAVADGVRTIASIAGQSFDDFLINTLPDLGATPAFAGAASAGATALSDAFNAQLMMNIGDLRAEGLNIFAYDVDRAVSAVFDDIADGSPLYGILDATTPCTVNIGAPLDPEFSNPGSCLDIGIDPNTLLFVDGVHPNAVAHQLVAEQVNAQIVAAIPLPATLPLLVTVLGGVGLVARRRKVA